MTVMHKQFMNKGLTGVCLYNTKTMLELRGLIFQAVLLLFGICVANWIRTDNYPVLVQSFYTLNNSYNSLECTLPMSRLAALLIKIRVGETDLQYKWLRRDRPHTRGTENGGLEVRRFPRNSEKYISSSFASQWTKTGINYHPAPGIFKCWEGFGEGRSALPAENTK